MKITTVTWGKLTARQSDKAIITTVGKDDPIRESYKVDVQDYQSLEEVEDRTSDVLICLDSTLDTVTTLASMYRKYFRKTSTAPPAGPSCVHQQDDYDEISSALDNKKRELNYSRKKVEAILSKAQNTRALVSSMRRSPCID